MSNHQKHKDCCVPQHEYITLRTAKMLNQIDPAGAYGSSEDLMEYFPEVPDFVDMILTDEVSDKSVREIMDSYFTPGFVRDSAIKELVYECYQIRQDWENRIELEQIASARWSALRTAFVRAYIKKCTLGPMCTCHDCDDMARLQNHLGLRHDLTTNRYTFFDLTDDAPLRLPNATGRLILLDFLESLRSSGALKGNDIMDGWLEVPEEIGQLLHDHGWLKRLEGILTLLPTDFEAIALIEGFLTAIAELVFTDEFLSTAQQFPEQFPEWE